MNRPATITPGQEVFITEPGSWDHNYILARVVRVTSTGQVVVQRVDLNLPERKFNARDSELGGSKFRTPFLSWEVAAIKKQLATTKFLKAAEVVMAEAAKPLLAFKHTWGADEATKAIEAARAALLSAEALLKELPQ